jgi:glycosyltransferase involved in cell wall biosynthesis
MKISIITPSLNSEKYIENNLKSVHLQQKSGDFFIEQVIIDGNSTDRTIDIIKAFREKYSANIKIIQGKDKNMYDAINKGLRAMTGDIWACLNTDDFYYPETLSLIAAEFSSHPEIDVVYGYTDMIDEDEKFLHTLYLPEFNLSFLILKGHCLTIQQPSSFLRRRVLDKVGFFDIDYRYASDYDYFIRIGSECNMRLIKRSLTQFREHPASISSNNITRSSQALESLSISEKYIKKYGIKKRSLLFGNLNFYSKQLRSNNLKYIKNRIREVISSNSLKSFMQERVL